MKITLFGGFIWVNLAIKFRRIMLVFVNFVSLDIFLGPDRFLRRIGVLTDYIVGSNFLGAGGMALVVVDHSAVVVIDALVKDLETSGVRLQLPLPEAVEALVALAGLEGQ